MTELEPLLKRIEQLTPSFGRAREDLAALTARGRNQDYKGVLQNARLVLEALLRSLVTTELKQTPGKAMLDELLNKFRQQANAGVIPTNILAHMGTVQAWGNLSTHDHAGGLHEEGVKVGLEEVATSLNSLVAILAWYKEHHAQEPVPPTVESPAATAPVQPSVAGAPSGRRTAILGGVILAVLVIGLVVLARRATVDSSRLRSRLDALAAENNEPQPPVACQEQDPRALAALAEVAPRLSDRLPESSRASEAAAALVALQARALPWRPEGWFLVARASLLAGHPDAEAMSSALKCPDFAAAENLAGRMAALSQDWEQSAAHYARAAELAPSFWKPRFNLGLIRLRQQRADQAVPMLERAAELAPEEGEIALFLGHAYKSRAAAAQAAGHAEEAAADLERARAFWCRARDHGAAQASALCKP